MKKILYSVFITLGIIFGTNAQCVPEASLTSGFHPTPGSYLADGCINEPYSDVISFRLPQDSTVDLSVILIGIVDIYQIQVLDVLDLPDGFTFSCSSPNQDCLVNVDESACILIEGTPDIEAVHTIRVATQTSGIGHSAFGDLEVDFNDTLIFQLRINETCEIIEEGDVTMTKSGNYNSETGVITYTFEVENVGNVTISNLYVDDQTIGVSDLPINPSTLEPGETGTATATYQVTQEDIDGGMMYNSATVNGTDENGNSVSDVGSTFTPIPQNPSISILKSGIYDASTGMITYTFEVTNTGNVTLSEVYIDDDIIDINNLEVTPSELAPEETGVATATYEVTQENIDAGGVWNIATVIATTSGGDEESGTSIAPNPIEPTDPNYNPECPDCTFTPIEVETNSSISLTKTGEYDAETGIITYTFNVENTGDITLSNIYIDDEIIGISGLEVNPSTLEPGETGTATTTYQVAQEDIDSGGKFNTATVQGKDSNGNLISAEGETYTPIDSDINSMLELNENFSYHLHPNPTSSGFTIDNLPSEGTIVSIFDNTGKLVEKIDVKAESIAVSTVHYKVGLYFVKINSNQGEETTKLIILE